MLDAAARLFTERGYESATIAGHRRGRRCLARDDLRPLPQQAHAARRARGQRRAGRRRRSGARAGRPARGGGGNRSARAAAALRRRHRPAPRARRPAARGSHAGGPRADPSSPSCERRSTAAATPTSGRSSTRSRANGPLRLEPDAALDDVWALASPELHQLLTGTRGWTRERYCGWLADSLGALLLES